MRRRGPDEMTVREAEVLSVVRDSIAEGGIAPSGRELGERLGCSTHSALHLLAALIRNGRLVRTLAVAVPGAGRVRVDPASAVVAREPHPRDGHRIPCIGIAYRVTAVTEGTG